jgi:AsnC-like helix-turn-helix protein
MMKVKTENTSSLERLISAIRSIEGVARTETMVVLSTHTERGLISVHSNGDSHEPANGRRHRHAATKSAPPDPRRVS